MPNSNLGSKPRFVLKSRPRSRPGSRPRLNEKSLRHQFIAVRSCFWSIVIELLILLPRVAKHLVIVLSLRCAFEKISDIACFWCYGIAPVAVRGRRTERS